MLEWSQESIYAGWFDIDWKPDHPYLRGKLLVPLLGEQYGIELEAGKLALKFDRANGDFAIWAYDQHKLPICPLHYSRILGDADPELERIGDTFAGLPDWHPQIVGRAGELKAELGRLAGDDPAVQQAIDAAVSQLNRDPAMLDALIRDQHWRAAHFRLAGDDINYRRFFDINDLAGLRMELPELFDHTHALVLRLLEQGTLDGSASTISTGSSTRRDIWSGCATKPRVRSILSSRKFSQITKPYARIGRSRVPPATISPIWRWRSSSTLQRKTG